MDHPIKSDTQVVLNLASNGNYVQIIFQNDTNKQKSTHICNTDNFSNTDYRIEASINGKYVYIYTSLCTVQCYAIYRYGAMLWYWVLDSSFYLLPTGLC